MKTHTRFRAASVVNWNLNAAAALQNPSIFDSVTIRPAEFRKLAFYEKLRNRFLFFLNRTVNFAGLKLDGRRLLFRA